MHDRTRAISIPASGSSIHSLVDSLSRLMARGSTGNDATTADDPSTEAKCVKMEAFLEVHQWQMPLRRSADPEEMKLRRIWDDLRRRCTDYIGRGTKPTEKKLTQQSRSRVERIEREQRRREAATEATPSGERGPTDADRVTKEPARRIPRRTLEEPRTDGRPKRPRTTPPGDNTATLCMRGLNIEWPFSQLLLMGVKTEEVRKYELDHRNICHAKQDTWIVEICGPPENSTTNAICDHLQIPPRPHTSQIVGIIRFDSTHQYDSTWADNEHCSPVLMYVRVYGPVLNSNPNVDGVLGERLPPFIEF